MRFFKIILGYDSEDAVTIDETELEKTFYVFLTGKKAILGGMPVNGERILSVRPDFHKAMGWNHGYKLGPDDYQELTEKGIDKSHSAFLESSKDKVQYLIKTNQVQLIGTGYTLPTLENAVAPEVKSLADAKRV